MQKVITLQLPYFKLNDAVYIRQIIQQELGIENFHYTILKQSIDARTKHIKINLKILVSDEPIAPLGHLIKPVFKEIKKNAPIVIIIGAGPAGLLAAIRCLEKGFKPVLFEQGKMVRDRRRDLANITKKGIVHPTSNYCFGEGGAGTYSDGKLYTRSDKRGDVDKILNYLVFLGASDNILVDTHPHVGTNKLPQIIENIRAIITENGGEIYYQHQFIDFTLDTTGDKIKSIFIKNLESATVNEIPCQHLILATGHSARAIYNLLYEKKVHIEFKPFAVGVRVEHPQEIIDSIQYHCASQQDLSNVRKYLSPARYSLVHTTHTFSAYSFCMCPGGIIATCATDVGEVVTNGWSPSKRNNPFANSGIVVAVNEKIISGARHHPLAGLYFQQNIEQRCFEMGGKNLFAPAQRLIDFVKEKESNSLPDCSYRPGVTSVNLKTCLPDFIFQSLKNAFVAFDKKMRGFLTEQAVVVAPETRTSSPVRIPRDRISYQHIQIKNLYPCGEGAGYAGGIVSAAIDGMNIVDAIETQIYH